MHQPAPPISSSQPDPGVLAVLARIQQVFLALAALAAGGILLGWILPPAASLLPHGWDLMKVNTTLLVLGTAGSIWLSQPRRSPRALLASRCLSIAVIAIAVLTLAEYAGHISLHIDTILAADAKSPMPGRLSLQTAWTFLFMGIIMSNIRARKGFLAGFMDLLTLVLCLMMLTFFSGYLFGAMHLYGLSLATRMAPQTLFCASLLGALVFNRRAEYGFFAILLGNGIGGRAARMSAPWAVALPFLLSGVRGLIERYNLIQSEYALAISASLMSLFGFCLVLGLSRKTNQLENAIRDLSLRDELTKLYNRRGFYFLAEQALLLSKRAGSPFFVLFVDMDNLKVINDTLGHEIGSERLKEIGALLEKSFRETDVVGRLGGDEFIVAGRADAIDLAHATIRLEQAAAAAHVGEGERYPLSFSLGYVVSERSSGETLDEMIERADAIMYQAKRKKKRGVAMGVLVSA